MGAPKYYVVVIKDDAGTDGRYIDDLDNKKWLADNLEVKYPALVTVQEVVEILPDPLTIIDVKKTKGVYVTGKGFGHWADNENLFTRTKVSR